MNIILKNIAKRYGEHWIFERINATFTEGNIYPITGGNGSGKSTLLQVISGFITPNSGSIEYAEDGALLPIESWFRHLSIAAPYLDLFEEFTVEESIALHEKLKALNGISVNELMQQIELLPHRNKQLGKLSSGMKQRLKLALAIQSRSSVLLLDEPCSNLDQKWTNWYNETLATHSLERITIICSNNHEGELKQANQQAITLSH